ncbi:hypothetical protein BC828DRAFT_152432 [Blastocladiella britannica]|nr:hypothetical protein BC828DRAFT_152432 [Blastocladiella britannica]
MHFLSSTPLHAAGNAVTWIQFLERIALEYAIDLIILDTLAFSELCCPFVPHQVYGQLRIADIRPAIANWKHMHAVMHLPGRRYIGVDGYYAAILKVQATWRMYSQRKEYLEMCVSKTAARVILAFRRKCLTRARFYDAVKNALTAHVLAVTTMRAQLISNWSKTYTGSSVHVILHVPSASFSERIRFMMRDVRHYHEHSAGRLSSALVEKSRVIYVSPYPKGADGMLEQALRYVGRSTRAPRAGSRTVVIYPECVPQIPKRAPLSLGLYVSTASINKIRATIMQLGPNSLVTLVPYIIDAYDVRVASMCGVAHLALPLDQQTFYSTRPGFFDLMHRVENREQLVEEGDEEEDENGGNNGGSADESATAIDGPLGRRFRGSWSGSRPHLVDLTEEAAVWTRLAEFLLAHPRVRTWMFKIRDEAGRRGVALFHRRRLTFSVAKFSVAEIAEKIRAIPEAFTFMTPRYVKSALGHHLALYTLPLEVPKVSAAQSAAQRRNSIRTDGESDDSAGIGGSDHQSSAFGAREQSPMVGHVSSGGGGGLLHVPKPSRLVKRKGDGDGLQASREIFNSTSMLIPNLPATIDPRDLPVPAYPTVPAFISSFCKTGGTVEAMADGTSDSRVFVGCHLELHPTGETLVMETWETIPLHDFDHFLMVMPARQVPPDVIVGQAIKVAGAALEKGMVGHICIEFVAYLDNPIIDLHCIEILPYWSPTAGLAGFARVVMDARYDYPRMSAASGIRLHRQPAPPFTGMGVVGPGEYVTDMSHLRPSNLRMAGQAKWLDLVCAMIFYVYLLLIALPWSM